MTIKICNGPFFLISSYFSHLFSEGCSNVLLFVQIVATYDSAGTQGLGRLYLISALPINLEN